MSDTDISRLPIGDRLEIVGQSLALSAGARPTKPHPWSADLVRSGPMTLDRTMNALGSDVRAFMNSPELHGAIGEALRVLVLSSQRPRDLEHRRLARLAEVRDFKTSRIPRVQPLTLPQQSSETAEVPAVHVDVTWEETAGLQVFSGIAPLSRQAIIDAQWDLLGDLATELIAACDRAERSAVFSVFATNPNLSDGLPLFHESRQNVCQTSGSIASSTLADACQRLRSLSVAGVNLGLRPFALVVDPSQELVAHQVLAEGAERMLTGGVFSDPSLAPHEWFLVPDPALAPAVVLTHLAGNTEPTLDSKNAFRADALGIRARHQFAVTAVAPLVVKNEGK